MAPLILVVEDEPPLAEMLCYNLEKADFRTVVAFTGEEAIGRAEIEIPDLVVVDWICLLYTSPSPRDQRGSRMPSSA